MLLILSSVVKSIKLDSTFTNTKNITEQLADKFRLAVGIGYRFTYEWRIEIDFYVQRLKNTTEAGFSITDNIWRFGLRHYL